MLLVVFSSSVVAIFIDDAVTTDHHKTFCCYHYFYIQQYNNQQQFKRAIDSQYKSDFLTHAIETVSMTFHWLLPGIKPQSHSTKSPLIYKLCMLLDALVIGL